MKPPVLSLAASLLAPLATLRDAAKPNISFIMADDLGDSYNIHSRQHNNTKHT